MWTSKVRKSILNLIGTTARANIVAPTSSSRAPEPRALLRGVVLLAEGLVAALMAAAADVAAAVDVTATAVVTALGDVVLAVAAALAPDPRTGGGIILARDPAAGARLRLKRTTPSSSAAVLAPAPGRMLAGHPNRTTGAPAAAAVPRSKQEGMFRY